MHNVNDDRLDESLGGARDAAAMMTAVKGRFMWIVFNKQDLLPPNEASTILAKHRQKFELELLAHAPTVNWQVVDIPGFSAIDGDNYIKLLEKIDDTFTNGHVQRAAGAASTAVPRRQKELGALPSEADLIRRIELEQNNDLAGDEFWDAFVMGTITEWNHRSHLKAGYILLLEYIEAGEGILACAETFLSHLKRLKDAAPDRFRNTEHRTMTIFWLHNLQLAILSFKSDKSLEKLPGRDLFNEVLLHSPHLMYGGLWKEWYTEELMMSPEAKEYWRLPDLQALPDFAERTGSQKRRTRRLSQEEPFRLIRFAFAVVQKYMSSDVRRGWLVKQSLAALQTTTMRLRSQNPDMRPYSETQAYFWIQIVHAALHGIGETSLNNSVPESFINRLSFSSFRVLFAIDPTSWRTYYTPATWESLEARMTFVAPDLKPLPNVMPQPHIHDLVIAVERQTAEKGIGMTAEIPSMEELALRSNILLHESAAMDETKCQSTCIGSHAHMLRFLYYRLRSSGSSDESPVAVKATAALMDMQGMLAESLTLKAFWTQQVLLAFSSSGVALSFDDMIRANMHLVYPDLPLCYFSPEVLQSLDAKRGIVAPDRRKFKAFLPVSESRLEEEDWVIM